MTYEYVITRMGPHRRPVGGGMEAQVSGLLQEHGDTDREPGWLDLKPHLLSPL